jgi:hypothetical protein
VTAAAPRPSLARPVSPLRVRPLAEIRPPIEVDLPRAARSARDLTATAAPIQGTLALALPQPVWAGLDDDQDRDFGPQPTPRSELPDPAGWARGLTQVLVEVLAGLRPSTQLLRWTTDEVYQVIRAATVPTSSGRSTRGPAPVRGRAGGARSAGQPARSAGPRPRAVVRSVRACEPADGVAEVSAVVSTPHRAQAVALRLEGHDGRWRVTALQVG